MAEPRDIQYRRMVSSIARELSAYNVEEIAYVRLTGKEDTTKYSAANPAASALDLLKTLERWGVFSMENINGLKEVVMDAGRKDLVDQINNFTVEESISKHTCLKKLFVKNRQRNKGRQKTDDSPTEELAGKFQDPDRRVLVEAERKASQMLRCSKIAQELAQIRKTSQDGGRRASAPTLTTGEGE